MAHLVSSAADDHLESTNRQSPAKSARVPKHNEEECELGPTNPSLAHRSQGNDAQAAGQKSEGALEECAGAAAAENEKRTVMWYVKADDDYPTRQLQQ